MLLRPDALEVLTSSGEELDELIRTGVVHVIQTVNSNFWICKTSLFVIPKKEIP
jgi:hypothetical protein